MLFKVEQCAPWETVFFQIDIKDAVLKIIDGGVNSTGTPAAQQSIEVTIGEGNLTYTENKNIEYVPDRGNLASGEVREGDEAPVDVTFDFKWEFITGTTPSTTGDVPTVEDALKRIGPAAAWVSTDSDACRPYAVDLELTHTPTAGCGDIETLTFPDFRHDSLAHDLRAGTVAATGRCNVTQITPVRTANP